MYITRRCAPFAVLAVLLLAAQIAHASPPLNCNAKDALTVTAGESDNGVTPTSPSQTPHNWFYNYCVPTSNSGLHDVIPVDFTLTNGDNVLCAADNVTVSFSANGNPAVSGAVTLPASFGMTDDGSTTTQYIDIDTSTLSPGNYQGNVQISVSPSGGTDISHNNIHISIEVGSQCSGEAASCFFLYQDASNGVQYLNDCSLQPVSGPSGGRFQIVPNKKRTLQVATNPGQFYYNAFWTNESGNDKDITIVFDDMTGAAYQSANALHAEVFPAGVDPLDQGNFSAVESGVACGPTGPCSITVPDGYTLWVLWHFNWSGIGSSTSGLGTTCPGDPAPSLQDLNVEVTLYDDQNNSLATCASSGAGYLKK